MKIVSVIEATSVNAVAKGAIEFWRTAREMANTQKDIGRLEGSFVTFDRANGEARAPNEFVQAARCAGIEVDIVPEKHRLDLSVLAALRTAIERRGPDIVITHSVKSHFLVWRSGIGKKYPWAAFHHGYTTTDRKMRLYNRLDRFSLTKADQVLTVCNAFARELAAIIRIPREKILVQHNAIRPQPPATDDVVRELKTDLGIRPGERIVLSVGRLSKEKAHADLIAAFARLRETDPDLNCKLIIVGDGPERDHLELAARASGQSELVVFVGQVRGVQPFYALADVFVLPSLSEGSPNVLLEAMAASVPVVATAVGGVPEMITAERTGILIPANDICQLSRAMARILKNRQLAETLTREAAEAITTRYTPEAYVANLWAIYEHVVRARRGE